MARPSSGRNYPDHHRQPDRHRHYDANHHALRLSPRLALARRVLSVLLHLLLFHKPGIRGAKSLSVKYHSIAGPSPPRSPYGVGYPHSSIHADRVYHILWGQHRLCESYHHFRPAFPRTADPHDYPTSIGFFLAIIRSVQSSFQSIKLLLTGGDIKVDAMTAVEEELDEASQQLFRNQKGGN